MTDALARSVVEGQRAGLIAAEYVPVQVARVIGAIVDGFAHAAAVCPNNCARTFIDTETPDGRTSRYISGFSCEKGTVESEAAMIALT